MTLGNTNLMLVLVFVFLGEFSQSGEKRARGGGESNKGIFETLKKKTIRHILTQKKT
jgi:hypothetical protein